MKKYFSLVVSLLLLAACNNQNPRGMEDIYENLSARYLNIYADKDFYVVNDAPITLSSEVLTTFFDTLRYVPVTYIANNDTLPSNTFAPSNNGRYTIKGVLPNGVISNILRVEAFDESDVERLKLQHNGVNYLTNNAWSFSGDFRQLVVIDGKEFELTQNEDIKLLLNGVAQDKKGGFQFEQAGEYDFSFKLGSLSSNIEKLYVREKKQFDEVVLPVVFHFINTDNYKSLAPGLISATNRLFSNTGISSVDVLRGGDNANKVNTYVKFSLASTAPAGESLDGPGIHVIQAGNGTITLSRMQQLARENYWNPNKYINIFVGAGNGWAFAGNAQLATLLGVELAGAPSVDTEPNDPIYNRVFLNANGGGMSVGTLAHELGHLLGLHHMFEVGCSLEGDYVTDTYAYNNPNGAFLNVTEDCLGNSFSKDNLMDYGGVERVFTYGQRERVRLVIDKGLFIPTPTNILKGKKKVMDPNRLIVTNKPIE